MPFEVKINNAKPQQTDYSFDEILEMPGLWKSTTPISGSILIVARWWTYLQYMAVDPSGDIFPVLPEHHPKWQNHRYVRHEGEITLSWQA